MNVVTSTPFHVAPIRGRLDFPKHSLTLVVKGAFDMSPGTVATPATDQPFPSGDILYRDDPEMRGGPWYESDFAHFKPRADLLLVGTCHPPGREATRTCQVTFRVGGQSQTLTVIGNRQWERHGLSWQPTEPEPFAAMELRYERSFGGSKFAKNPVGSGSHEIVDEHGEEIYPLPNLEDPRAPIESRRSRPEPAGFAPLGRMWETRLAKAGTYNDTYLETRWPWFPEDFDWAHFNAAPEQMQVEGYLRGDEQLYLENLHPVHSRYESRLPGLRVRCFVTRLTASESGQTDFVEVAMNLDTLWVDMEAEKLVLVWRGWTDVASEDHEDVQDLFIMSEDLDRAPASTEDCYQAFLASRAEEEKELELAPQLLETGKESPGEGPGPEAPAGPHTAELEAQANALMARVGIDVEALSSDAKKEQSRLIRKLSETDPDKLAELEQRELDEQMRAALGKLDLDPDNLPPLSAKAMAEQFRYLKEMGIKDPHLAADPELSKTWAMMAAVLPKVGMDPENLDPLIEQAKKMNLSVGGEDDEEPVAEETLETTREAVAERAARGESFAGEDLHNLDLSELDLHGLDFSAANLAGVKLTKAKLAGAVLVKANLERADLTGADLTAANLAGADLSSANLDGASLQQADVNMGNLTEVSLVGAVLTDANFEKAQMAGSVGDKAEARDTIFVGADLTGASFRESDCSGGDFSHAVLDQAAFSRAKLVEASFTGAVGRKIRLADTDLTSLRAGGGCDFTGGVFWRAAGEGSIWEDADLTGADFREARMPGALFTRACLKGASLMSSDMPGSRFTTANLHSARLVEMNLFRGSLEKADLTGADLSGSNLYEAEFLDAVIDETDMSGANLKMTTLDAS